MFDAVKGLFKTQDLYKKQYTMKNVNFGLFNPAEGSGTYRALDSYNDRTRVPYLTYNDIDEIFRSNWMAKKVIETPASDMTRKWRNYQYEDPSIIKTREKADRRLNVINVVREAIQWADLYGGSAIILGLNDEEDASKPLNLRNLKKGDLQFLNVVFKDQITPSAAIEIDPYSLNFQKPQFYYIAGTSNRSQIHASRVIQFYGAELPLYSLLRQAGWGDSRLISTWAIIEAAEKMWLNISQLISQATIDVIQLKDYMNLLANERSEQIVSRMNFTENMTSSYKKLILDTEDKYERKELTNVQGLANIMIEFLQMIAGAAGMPLTVFLGTSINGFSSGDMEITKYYDSIHERQNRLYKQMNYLDKIIEISTFGNYLGIDFEWESLREMDDNQKSEISLKRAQRDDMYLRMGIIDEAIIAEQLQNDGTYSSIDNDWIAGLKNNPPALEYEDVQN
ncbi:DUF1073 domain-containing protein [bacterium]|nr:DUF1073 domain-containing protein [bacterium]